MNELGKLEKLQYLVEGKLEKLEPLLQQLREYVNTLYESKGDYVELDDLYGNAAKFYIQYNWATEAGTVDIDFLECLSTDLDEIIDEVTRVLREAA